MAKLPENIQQAARDRLKKKPPLGSGERFKQLANKVGSPALAAYIGRKKYGDAKMQQMAANGRK